MSEIRLRKRNRFAIPISVPEAVPSILFFPIEHVQFLPLEIDGENWRRTANTKVEHELRPLDRNVSRGW